MSSYPFSRTRIDLMWAGVQPNILLSLFAIDPKHNHE